MNNHALSRALEKKKDGDARQSRRMRIVVYFATIVIALFAGALLDHFTLEPWHAKRPAVSAAARSVPRGAAPVPATKPVPKPVLTFRKPYHVCWGDNISTITKKEFGTAAPWYFVAKTNHISGFCFNVRCGTTLKIPNLSPAQIQHWKEIVAKKGLWYWTCAHRENNRVAAAPLPTPAPAEVSAAPHRTVKTVNVPTASNVPAASMEARTVRDPVRSSAALRLPANSSAEAAPAHVIVPPAHSLVPPPERTIVPRADIERPVSKKVPEKLAKVAPAGGEGWYEIPVLASNIPGLVPGMFPALYLEHQRKDGKWSKRRKISFRVTKSDREGILLCYVRLKRPPARDGAIAVNFGQGNPLLEITSDPLERARWVGKRTQWKRSAFPKKRYAALDMRFPKHMGLLTSTLLRIAPFAIRSGPLLAVGGLPGAIMVTTSGAGSALRGFAANKLRNASSLSADPPPPPVQYVLQQKDKYIQDLDVKVQELSDRIRKLEQEHSETTSAKAQTDKEERQ